MLGPAHPRTPAADQDAGPDRDLQPDFIEPGEEDVGPDRHSRRRVGNADRSAGILRRQTGGRRTELKAVERQTAIADRQDNIVAQAEVLEMASDRSGSASPGGLPQAIPAARTRTSPPAETTASASASRSIDDDEAEGNRTTIVHRPWRTISATSRERVGTAASPAKSTGKGRQLRTIRRHRERTAHRSGRSWPARRGAGADPAWGRMPASRPRCRNALIAAFPSSPRSLEKSFT